MGNQCRIAVLEHSFEIIADIALSLQISDRVPWNSLWLSITSSRCFAFPHGHNVLLESAGQRERHRDVFPLRVLVASSEQDDESWAALREIDPVTGPIIDPHFGNTTTNRLHIARITYLQPIDAHLNSALCSTVAQPGKPAGKVFSLANFDQRATVAHKIRNGKAISAGAASLRRRGRRDGCGRGRCGGRRGFAVARRTLGGAVAPLGDLSIAA